METKAMKALRENSRKHFVAPGTKQIVHLNENLTFASRGKSSESKRRGLVFQFFSFFLVSITFFLPFRFRAGEKACG